MAVKRCRFGSRKRQVVFSTVGKCKQEGECEKKNVTLFAPFAFEM